MQRIHQKTGQKLIKTHTVQSLRRFKPSLSIDGSKPGQGSLMAFFTSARDVRWIRWHLFPCLFDAHVTFCCTIFSSFWTPRVVFECDVLTELVCMYQIGEIEYIHQPIQDFYLDFQYQGGVKSTVSGVFEDLKFKISEGYKQN